MDANRLRRAFTGFFVERGHATVPSASLIPHHPAAPMFTVAGMVPFIPYFLGDEVPPHQRATSVQKCFRTPDIDIIGTTTRHITFFEMMGNFSFGDYFKEGAIPFAWEFVTESLGLDADRLWVTVHHSDDDAAQIWHDTVGVPVERIQQMGDDNWWQMAKGGAGPCGPCSELYWDKGPAYGEAGGPAGGGDERYIEIWNLVFMQFNQRPDGRLDPLPRSNIDTGAGLERIVSVLQGTDSVFETDGMRRLVAAAEAVTGRRYGQDERTDVALRILADHGRSMTFLVADGVFPSNEERGYVLRRMIRRAVRHAFQLGVERLVTPAMVDATVEVMAEAYPELHRHRDFVSGVVTREEERFRATLRSGLAMLDAELADGGRVDGGRVDGEVAFRLHDTHGFPIELTRELAGERGAEVDEEGFRLAMDRQRSQSKSGGRRGGDGDANLDTYRELVDQFGTTAFLGYTETSAQARVLAVLPAGDDRVEVFVDRTPCYAESGGQVGDTGTVTTPTGSAEVVDTTYALPGLHRHLAVVTDGQLAAGQEAEIHIDAVRRDALRRNHTGTHLLHWALREILGPHVKQAGSLVAPDRLRFDFSHYSGVDPVELGRVEDLVNERILADEPVKTLELDKEEAERMGAVAFFGDKYGDRVRVIEAGTRSLEFCGGTHVSALGMIGSLRVVAEGSIGANLRRIEAVTGTGSLNRFRQTEETVARAASLLRAGPDELLPALERRLAELRAATDELKALRQAALRDHAHRLAGQARSGGGIVVDRLDGLSGDQLREVAASVRAEPGIRAVVLGGSPGPGKVSLVAAVPAGSDLVASDLIAEAARAVGGGGGRSPELAMAGGRDPSGLDAALDDIRARLGG